MNTPRLFACIAAIALSLACASTGYAKSSGFISFTESMAISTTTLKAPSFSSTAIGGRRFAINDKSGIALGFGIAIPNSSEPVVGLRLGISYSHSLTRIYSLGASTYYQYSPATGAHNVLVGISNNFKVTEYVTLALTPGANFSTRGVVNLTLGFGPSIKF